MNILAYFEKINRETQTIFSQTIRDHTSFGETHHIASCIYEFSEFIFDPHEKELLGTVSAQIEAASLNLALGLYRPAFSSLRLAFEMGLAVAHFSVHKLEHYEWLKGEADIKWAKIIDSENGILSKRFTSAFFPELSEYIEEYNSKAALVYRKLSEFVHGNSETWKKSGIIIQFNQSLIDQYFNYCREVSEVILFVLCCRYLKSFPPDQLESMEFIPSELNHIAAIREIFGGPKDII